MWSANKGAPNVVSFDTAFIPDMKIGPENFINEKSGKFSDYYQILTRLGEGGYGQVFKVVHKKSQLIRAMKSRIATDQ